MSTSHSWPMQETSGTSVVDAISANDGTIDASVASGVAGPGGSYPLASEFAGGSTTPVILDSPITLSRKHDWSIKFWAKQDSASQKGMILGDRGSATSFVWLSSSYAGLVVRSTHAVPVTGTNDGLDVVFLVPSATRTKWSEYELTYDVSGTSPTLTLVVDGVFVATETAAEGIGLFINTLGAGHSNSTFSLDGQLAGIEVTGTEIDFSSPDRVVLVLGQSNAEGRFINNQAYSHPTRFASVFEGGQWSELFDLGTHGEVWPVLATRWLANRNESVGFIYAAVGGTGLVNSPDWADGGTTYEAAIEAVAASGVTRIDAVLWFQGERDANLNVTREAYVAGMADLIVRLRADLPGEPPLLCGQINSVPSGTSDEIRNAQMDSWANEHILPGPVTYDLGPLADDLHFTTDAEAITLADRWWAAIDEALFEGANGTPLRLVSTVVDGASIGLAFDRDLESATSYDAAAWSFTDNGESIAVVSAIQTSSRTVELSLAEIPKTSSKTLTLGEGSSAQGLSVPRGVAGQPALPETASVVVPTQIATGAASMREAVRVKSIRRAISIS